MNQMKKKKMNQMEKKKKSIAKYFRRKSSLAYFQSALELLANLMQVTPFYFKLKFSVEKLMDIRSQCS